MSRLDFTNEGGVMARNICDLKEVKIDQNKDIRYRVYDFVVTVQVNGQEMLQEFHLEYGPTDIAGGEWVNGEWTEDQLATIKMAFCQDAWHRASRTANEILDG